MLQRDVICPDEALGHSTRSRHYHCVCRTITFNGMAKAIAAAAGKEAKIVYYDPEELGLGKGSKAEGFPFRTVHFFASAGE